LRPPARAPPFPYTTLFRSDVGTALGGGDAGLLVPPGDPAALAAALDRLLSNPGRARSLGTCAARRAAAEYAERLMTRRYNSLYQDRKSTRLNSSHVSISYA